MTAAAGLWTSAGCFPWDIKDLDPVVSKKKGGDVLEIEGTEYSECYDTIWAKTNCKYDYRYEMIHNDDAFDVTSGSQLSFHEICFCEGWPTAIWGPDTLKIGRFNGKSFEPEFTPTLLERQALLKKFASCDCHRLTKRKARDFAGMYFAHGSARSRIEGERDFYSSRTDLEPCYTDYVVDRPKLQDKVLKVTWSRALGTIVERREHEGLAKCLLSKRWQPDGFHDRKKEVKIELSLGGD